MGAIDRGSTPGAELRGTSTPSSEGPPIADFLMNGRRLIRISNGGHRSLVCIRGSASSGSPYGFSRETYFVIEIETTISRYPLVTTETVQLNLLYFLL